ncbi:hypothetical protein ABMA57_13080 [Saccharospirillum sp. HFRX-1]|uniref:hypothetical protein n=1 Tax=unclassified Saccharospirillum TaxID=2633430 RepID=UPI0037129014
MMPPTEAQVRETVQRMEHSLKQNSLSEIQSLLEHYYQLRSRFQSDLGNHRDCYLAQASALMLIQAVAQSHTRG